MHICFTSVPLQLATVVFHFFREVHAIDVLSFRLGNTYPCMHEYSVTECVADKRLSTRALVMGGTWEQPSSIQVNRYFKILLAVYGCVVNTITCVFFINCCGWFGNSIQYLFTEVSGTILYLCNHPQGMTLDRPLRQPTSVIRQV